MRRLLLLYAMMLPAVLGAGVFEDDFTGATMRVDLFHTGDASQELISLDQARVEGPWPGSRTRLLDTLNLGKFFFEVVDLDTSRTLYSRGFASIFGEWETTGEASRGVTRTFAEALRFPEPRRSVHLRLRKRQPDRTFREIWSVRIDPRSRLVDRAPVEQRPVVEIQQSGPARVKVDLLLLGDGYSAAEREDFLADARRLSEALFSVEPFRSRRDEFNVRAVFTAATESGVSRPRSAVFRRTPLGASYNSLDSERYVLTSKDRAWRDVAAAAPYDAVVLLVNDRKYGGGGIYNLYATAAADSSFSPYLFVHEFGHHFAGLGDEYYTSDVAYEDFVSPSSEPWEPNITALLDPEALKWSDLVEAGTPLPTPWEKAKFEKVSAEIQDRRRELRSAGAPEEDLEALFREERERLTAMLASQEYAGRVGAFEGAGYEARGLFRPAADCMMFTRDDVGFCPVCRRAIERVIDYHVGRLDP